MSVLDWITIEGFKSIKRVERLEIRPINVLIGPNGSGKSNFIKIFSFLNAIRNGALRDYVQRVGGAERVLHFGSKTTPSLVIHVSFENETNQYRIQLSADKTDNLFASEETVRFRGSDRKDMSFGGKGGEAQISNSPLEGLEIIEEYLRSHFDYWRLYQFHDTGPVSPMKKTADVDDNRYLRPDGSNLPAFLYLLQEKHQSSYNLIRSTVRLVAPFFDDFQLQPQALNEDKIRLEWWHQGSDAYFDASSFSDGSLRFIALATLLLQPEQYRPSIILVDEPELGLHPYAVAVLASLFKQASEKTQIVFATQSSLLLDHFSPEDVLVANRVDGASEFTRPDGERLKKWLEDYSLGQLWEKNEIGGRPASEK